MGSKLPKDFEINFNKIIKRTEEDDFKTRLEELNLRNLCDENLEEEQIRFQLLVAVILCGQSNFEQLQKSMVIN